MSLTSSVQRIVQAKADIKTAIEAKGVTVGSDVSIANYNEYIAQITTGSSATLVTKTITANGTYLASQDNADGYSSVTVNVSGGGGGASVPFDQSRYWEIPVGGLYSISKIGKYIIGSPYRPDSSSPSVVGNKFVIYNTETRTVVHTKTAEESWDFAWLSTLEYADGYYVCIISRWNTTQKPYAVWLIDTNNDNITYYEDSSTMPYGTYLDIRYAAVRYKGKDFGIIQTTNGGQDCMAIIKPDGTFQVSCTCSYSVSSVQTSYDDTYYYIGAYAPSYEFYRTYAIAKVLKSTGNLDSIIVHNLGTSTSYDQRTIYLFGGFMAGLGYSTNRYGWIRNINTPNSGNIYSTTNTSYSGRVMVLNGTQQIVAVNNGNSFMFDGARFLAGTTPYYKTDNRTGLNILSTNALNDKPYISGYGLWTFTIESGFVELIHSTANTGANKCPNGNDLIVAATVSGQYYLYVYHTLTDTYDSLKSDTILNAYISQSATMFTRIETSPFYYGNMSSGGYIVYNSTTDEYIYLRRNAGYSSTTARVNNNEYLCTSGCYADETIPRDYLIKATGGYITCQVNTSATTNPNITYAYKYNDKLYYQHYISSSEDYMMCYDETNDALSVSLAITDNVYSATFCNTTSNANYMPVIQGNNVIFPTASHRHDGKQASYIYQSNGIYMLVFNMQSETWKAITAGTVYLEQHYNNDLVVAYNMNSSQIVIYNLSADTSSNLSIAPASMQSVCCTDGGRIIVKTTTALIKYNISTSTQTTLRTVTNNSTSNSYGTMRIIDNICWVVNNAFGIYNDTTDTFTSYTVQTGYYSSSYSGNVFFEKISSNFYIFGYKDASNLYLANNHSFTSPDASYAATQWIAGYIDALEDGYCIVNSQKPNVMYSKYDTTNTRTVYKQYNPLPLTSSTINTNFIKLTINGKSYYWHNIYHCYYDIENGEWFTLPCEGLNNSTSWGGAYFSTDIFYSRVVLFDLRIRYVSGVYDGSFGAAVTNYTNNVRALGTSSTTTYVVGLWQPTPAELGE